MDFICLRNDALGLGRLLSHTNGACKMVCVMNRSKAGICRVRKYYRSFDLECGLTTYFPITNTYAQSVE